MQTLKFRWFDPQGVHYRTIILPDSAKQMLYVDNNGVEVYAGEPVCDDKDMYFTEIIIDNDPKALSSDRVELTRTVDRKPTWCNAPFIEHEPLYLTEELKHFVQSCAVGDKIVRDARLLEPTETSVFDLLPDLSELRDID